MQSIRCSSLPRIVACAPAAQPPAVKIESPRGPSDLGTGFHSCMAAIAKCEEFDIAATAAENHVELGDLAPLVGWAAQLWRGRLAPHFPEPQVETALSFDDGDGLVLTGTPDLLSIIDGEARIPDWKSGWLDTDATEQLKGYGFLAWKNNPGLVERVRLTKLHVRSRTAETTVWEVAELDAWWQWLKRHVTDTQTFRPGPHCGLCPRALECPAHQRVVKSLAMALLGEELCVPDVPPEALIQTLGYVRIIGRMCDQWQVMLKAHVEANGGRFGRLALAERKTRAIDALRAFHPLAEEFGTEDILPTLRVNKEDLETLVKGRAPHRGKGAAIKDLYSRLESVGAIVETNRTQLEVLPNGDSNTTQLSAGSARDNDAEGGGHRPDA